MPEPASTTATTTFVAANVTVTALTAFGIPLGLRADLMVAGFSGGLVAIILLATVPSSGDTWRSLLRDTTRRMAVVLASSLTAGYLTPLMAMLITNVPEPLLLSSAFVVGGGAQHVFGGLIQRFAARARGVAGEGTP